MSVIIKIDDRDCETSPWAARLPLADHTKRQAAQYLSRMFEGAVDDGLIAQNPAHRAKRPRVDVEPIVPFTAEEAKALEAAAE